jgi:hypothetical protein
MTKPDSSKALGIGVAGIAVTALGILVSGAHVVATAWLVGIGFWTAVAIGMLMMILIHHIFDASWSTVLRRQYEHGIAAFPGSSSCSCRSSRPRTSARATSSGPG